MEVRVGQVWEQVSKHERGMQLEVVRDTGRRWVLRPVGGGPSKKRGLREGLWTASTSSVRRWRVLLFTREQVGPFIFDSLSLWSGLNLISAGNLPPSLRRPYTARPL